MDRYKEKKVMCALCRHRDRGTAKMKREMAYVRSFKRKGRRARRNLKRRRRY